MGTRRRKSWKKNVLILPCERPGGMSYFGCSLWVLLCSLTLEGIWGKRADVCDPSLGEVAVVGDAEKKGNHAVPRVVLGMFQPKTDGRKTWSGIVSYFFGEREGKTTDGVGKMGWIWQREAVRMLCYWLGSSCGPWLGDARGEVLSCCSGVLPALLGGPLPPPDWHFWGLQAVFLS